MDVGFIIVAPSANVGPTGAVQAAAATAYTGTWNYGAVNNVILIPNADPGVTGMVFAVNNTLKISQGVGKVAIQVGATGPTGITGATV